MGFDLSTAKPVAGGFDLSTAKGLEETPPQAPPQAAPKPQLTEEQLAGSAPMMGVVEPALEMITGAGAAAYGGLKGLGRLAIGGSADDAAADIRQAQEKYTYSPKHPVGQAVSDAIAWPVEKAAEGWGMIGGEIGNQVNGEQGRLAGEAIGETGMLSSMILAGKPWRMGSRPKTLGGELNKTVKTGLSKSDTIKQTGLKSDGQIEAAYKRATDAVESIVNRKADIVYRDSVGETAKGRVPQNLTEFSQAIAQLKKKVREEYNSRAKATDGVGAEVSQRSIITELESFIDDPVYQQHSPQAVRYATKKILDFENNPTISAEGAETAIAMYNDRLNAFSQNPHPNGVSNATVDAMIRDHLRKNLDETVTSATGEGYAKLKKEYGNLSSIEEQVSKRRMRDDNAQGHTPLNFYDVISAHDAISGLITANPVQLGKAGAIAILSKKLKMSRDPNRAVNTMFKDSEKAINKQNRNPRTLAEQLIQSKAKRRNTNASRGVTLASQLMDN